MESCAKGQFSKRNHAHNNRNYQGLIVPNFTYRLNNINWIEEIYRPDGEERDCRSRNWKEDSGGKIVVEDIPKTIKTQERNGKQMKKQNNDKQFSLKGTPKRQIHPSQPQYQSFIKQQQRTAIKVVNPQTQYQQAKPKPQKSCKPLQKTLKPSSQHQQNLWFEDQQRQKMEQQVNPKQWPKINESFENVQGSKRHYKIKRQQIRSRFQQPNIMDQRQRQTEELYLQLMQKQFDMIFSEDEFRQFSSAKNIVVKKEEHFTRGKGREQSKKRQIAQYQERDDRDQKQQDFNQYFPLPCVPQFEQQVKQRVQMVMMNHEQNQDDYEDNLNLEEQLLDVDGYLV